MTKDLSNRHKYIIRLDSQTFLHLLRAYLREHKTSRIGYLEVTDLQSHPDVNCKLNSTYRDHLTQSVTFKALHRKRPGEVAYELTHIFAKIGASSVLQSDKVEICKNKIIRSLTHYFPKFTILHCKHRLNTSQGSVETFNQ